MKTSNHKLSCRKEELEQPAWPSQTLTAGTNNTSSSSTIGCGVSVLGGTPLLKGSGSRILTWPLIEGVLSADRGARCKQQHATSNLDTYILELACPMRNAETLQDWQSNCLALGAHVTIREGWL